MNSSELQQRVEVNRKHTTEEVTMKKSLLTKLAILLLVIASLSGCLWVVEDDGYGRGGGGGYRGGGHDDGGHRGGRH